jgi:hypothetical protein
MNRIGDVTITTSSGQHMLLQGIQLRERKLVPKQLGRLVLWLFFHRTDSATQVTLSGFVNPLPTPKYRSKTQQFEIRLVIALVLFGLGLIILRLTQ